MSLENETSKAKLKKTISRVVAPQIEDFLQIEMKLKMRNASKPIKTIPESKQSEEKTKAKKQVS